MPTPVGPRLGLDLASKRKLRDTPTPEWKADPWHPDKDLPEYLRFAAHPSMPASTIRLLRQVRRR